MPSNRPCACQTEPGITPHTTTRWPAGISGAQRERKRRASPQPSARRRQIGAALTKLGEQTNDFVVWDQGLRHLARCQELALLPPHPPPPPRLPAEFCSPSVRVAFLVRSPRRKGAAAAAACSGLGGGGGGGGGGGDGGSHGLGGVRSILAQPTNVLAWATAATRWPP